MFFLEICYDSNREQIGPALGWAFDARLAGLPYVMQIQVEDPLSTEPGPPILYFTVSILDVENPPILTYPDVSIAIKESYFK